MKKKPIRGALRNSEDGFGVSWCFAMTYMFVAYMMPLLAVGCALWLMIKPAWVGAAMSGGAFAILLGLGAVFSAVVCSVDGDAGRTMMRKCARSTLAASIGMLTASLIALPNSLMSPPSLPPSVQSKIPDPNVVVVSLMFLGGALVGLRAIASAYEILVAPGVERVPTSATAGRN